MPHGRSELHVPEGTGLGREFEEVAGVLLSGVCYIAVHELTDIFVGLFYSPPLVQKLLCSSLALLLPSTRVVDACDRWHSCSHPPVPLSLILFSLPPPNPTHTPSGKAFLPDPPLMWMSLVHVHDKHVHSTINTCSSSSSVKHDAALPVGVGIAVQLTRFWTA